VAVLTSRFVFADLERYLGTAFHQIELHGLPPEQGAALLAELNVRGTVHDRKEISERLDGHPLGLRVFAGALPEADRDEPLRFLDHAFHVNELPADAPLDKRVTSLLSFYDKKLPTVQIRLLGVVALFRTPVPDSTVVRLARGLFGDKSDDPLPDDATLALELQKLHALGILSREPLEGGQGSACHPILRDHFRSVLLGSGPDAARRAADLLKGQPSADKPQSVKEIEPVLLAVELLLDAGDFQSAHQLYLARLESGKVFRRIPAVGEGLTCALGFGRDEERRRQCEAKLSQNRLSFFLNGIALFASLCGQYELALEYYSDANAIDRETLHTKNLSIGLQNETDLLVYLGRLAEAQQTASEALRLATRERDEAEIRDSHTYHGWAALLFGQVRSAAEEFARANELQKKDDPEGNELYSVRGIQWAELLFRTGHPALAVRRTEANLRICEESHWNADIARSHWMLGACALAEGRLDDAEAQLQLAEPILHRGQILFWLARVHITAGHVAIARQDLQSALSRAAEALDVAAPRRMRLIHVDALVLRGRARLLEAQSDSALRALDDAEEALRLARDCGYAWGERDALFLQAEAYSTLDRRDAAHRVREDAKALAGRLTLTQADLDDAEAKAKAWLAEWERSEPKSE
jgi:tetratricopeptide (TPR) repeat protein